MAQMKIPTSFQSSVGGVSDAEDWLLDNYPPPPPPYPSALPLVTNYERYQPQSRKILPISSRLLVQKWSVLFMI